MIGDAVNRLTAPVLDRIPDLSEQSLGRQIGIALIAAVIIHLLIILIVVGAIQLTPQRVEVKPVPVEEKPLEIEVVPLPKTEPERMALDEKKARELMLSNGMAKADKRPDEVQFESDQDMKAGSELPASGLVPLPSQDGREDRSHLAYTEQDVIISLNTVAPGAVAPESPETTQASKAPEEMYKPQPIRPEPLETKLPTPASTPPPKTDQLARATPAPMRPVPIAKENEIAIGAPQATPVPQPRRPTPVPITQAPQQMAKLTTPKPLDSYRERMEKARVEGSISNRGRPGVNAAGTPLGVYVKNVSTIVGSRWNFKVKEQMEWLTAGDVRIRFTVDRQGRTGNIQVVSNNSNRNFADLCVQVIRDSKLDPIPPEVAEHLEEERLEIPFTFTLYPTH